MKYLISTVILALLVSSVAFAQNGKTTTNEVSIERKVNHFVDLQYKLANLPYSKSKLINEVFPYVDSLRSELAPSFPEVIFIEHLTLSRTEKNEYIQSWILAKPEEHAVYTAFLEKLFRGVITL